MSPASMAAPPTPAGPGPKPSGPTHPVPTGPGPGRVSDLTGEMLRAIDASLIGLLGVAVSLPLTEDRMQVCGEEVLKHRLRMARAAVADLIAYTETPARQHLSSAAAVADGPVKPPARTGECLTPGSGAALSGAVTESAGSAVDLSAGAISGRGGKDASAASRPVQPRAGEPPLPGADFRLPRDVRGPLLDALNRRAD